MEIATIFEDEDLLAVNKPAGLPTQAGRDPKRINLYSLLQQQRGEKLYLHHRLDKDTSGVLILSRQKRINKALTEMFRNHQFTKIYWALTKKLPHPEETSQLIVKDHLAEKSESGKKHMMMQRVSSGGAYAETHFKKIESLTGADLWEAKPLTGRTHQIRVHLSNLNRPIWGDSLYGGNSSEVPRLLLHARQLRFRHPLTGVQLDLEAPLPRDFQALLKKWGSAGIY